jgi:hypothetical protein
MSSEKARERAFLAQSSTVIELMPIGTVFLK